MLKIHKNKTEYRRRKCGEPMPKDNGPLSENKQKNKPLYSREEVGIIGSYSSFFGFLLIATILSFRHIVLTLIELVHTGWPDADIMRVSVMLLLLFTLVFVIIPAYPILLDIRYHQRRGETKFVWMLIFRCLSTGSPSFSRSSACARN